MTELLRSHQARTRKLLVGRIDYHGREARIIVNEHGEVGGHDLSFGQLHIICATTYGQMPQEQSG